MNTEPTYEDICAILDETPATMFLTMTRANAALQHLFGDRRPDMLANTDPEANPDNYEGSRQVDCQPMRAPIFVGAKVTLTKNLNKPGDYVNGMSATVEDVLDGGILVRAATGKPIMVYPWTDPSTKHVYYPLRSGYASTLHKVQGATLPHVTFWLDVPNVEAAGCVAMSRVKYDKDWRFIGNASVHHFAPVTGL